MAVHWPNRRSPQIFPQLSYPYLVIVASIVPILSNQVGWLSQHFPHLSHRFQYAIIPEVSEFWQTNFDVRPLGPPKWMYTANAVRHHPHLWPTCRCKPTKTYIKKLAQNLEHLKLDGSWPKTWRFATPPMWLFPINAKTCHTSIASHCGDSHDGMDDHKPCIPCNLTLAALAHIMSQKTICPSSSHSCNWNDRS